MPEKLNEAEEDAARPELLSGFRSTNWGLAQDLRGIAGRLIVAAVAFLLVAGIGAVTSYIGNRPEVAGSGVSLSRSGSNGEMLERLTDYARSIRTEQPASLAAASKLLPDVDTMIERLEARLEATQMTSKAGGRSVGPTSKRRAINRQLPRMLEP
jgi:hypothetical protein